MFAQFLKKSFSLLIIYAVLIIGIFILQFKNDSIISEKLGSLHVTLYESASDNNNISLKNRFAVKFNGLNFTGTEDSPVHAVINGREREIALTSWKKLSALSCELDFTNNIAIRFAVSDDTSKAHFSMESVLPSNVSRVLIPYSFAVGTSIDSETSSQIQVSNKKSTWELNAFGVGKNTIALSKAEPVASYAFYDKSRSFSFEDVLSLEVASESSYSQSISNLKSNLINAFAQIPADSSAIGEQEVVSYVAAMAENGNYNAALDAVPQNFKRSALRTFLSAPYFDTLARINEPLQAQLRNYSEMISRANESSSFDIFNVRFISDFMSMHPGSSSIRSLLSKAASADFSGTSVQQVAAILSVYDDLAEKNPELANILSGAAPKCIEKILASCAVDENTITIAENGTFLSVIQAVQVGDSLLRYGNIVHNASYSAGGRFIINSYLKNSSSFDLRTLGEIYPIVVHNNKFYPHFEILAFNNGRAVWAWTCANNITYANDNMGTITLNIDFPLSYTHYVILNGIEKFQTIYIYDMAFRTDYRFETYNSSGYVYQNDTKSLLLKSRHKSQVETIRLVYPNPAAARATTSESVNSASSAGSASANMQSSTSSAVTSVSEESVASAQSSEPSQSAPTTESSEE